MMFDVWNSQRCFSYHKRWNININGYEKKKENFYHFCITISEWRNLRLRSALTWDALETDDGMCFEYSLMWRDFFERFTQIRITIIIRMNGNFVQCDKPRSLSNLSNIEDQMYLEAIDNTFTVVHRICELQLKCSCRTFNRMKRRKKETERNM